MRKQLTTKQIVELRQMRRDLTDIEWLQYLDIRDRGEIGMCTMADLKRRAELEPVQAHCTLVYNERTKKSNWIWRVDYRAGSFGYDSGPLRTKSRFEAEKEAAYISRVVLGGRTFIARLEEYVHG